MNISTSSAKVLCSEIQGRQAYRVQDGPIISIDGTVPGGSIILICEKSGLSHINPQDNSINRVVLCPSHLLIGSLMDMSSAAATSGSLLQIKPLSFYESYCHDLGNGCRYFFSAIPCTNTLMVCSWKLEIVYDVRLLPGACIEGFLSSTGNSTKETANLNPSSDDDDDDDDEGASQGNKPARIPILAPLIYILGANGCSDQFLERVIPKESRCVILVPMWCASMVDRNRANLILRHTIDQVADTIRSACLSGSRILMIADRPLETLLILGEYLMQIFKSLPTNYMRSLTVIDATDSLLRFREAYKAVHSHLSSLLTQPVPAPEWFNAVEFNQLSAPVLYDAQHQQNFSCFLVAEGRQIRDALQHVEELPPSNVLNTRPSVDCAVSSRQQSNKAPNARLIDFLNILGQGGDTVIIDFLEAGKMGPRKHYKQFKMTNHEVLHTNAFEPPPPGSELCLEYLQGTHNLSDESSCGKSRAAEFSAVNEVWYSRRSGNKVLLGSGNKLAEYCVPANIDELIANPSSRSQQPNVLLTADARHNTSQSITMTNMFDLKLLLAESSAAHTE